MTLQTLAYLADKKCPFVKPINYNAKFSHERYVDNTIIHLVDEYKIPDGVLSLNSENPYNFSIPTLDVISLIKILEELAALNEYNKFCFSLKTANNLVDICYNPEHHNKWSFIVNYNEPLHLDNSWLTAAYIIKILNPNNDINLEFFLVNSTNLGEHLEIMKAINPVLIKDALINLVNLYELSEADLGIEHNYLIETLITTTNTVLPHNTIKIMYLVSTLKAYLELCSILNYIMPDLNST